MQARTFFTATLAALGLSIGASHLAFGSDEVCKEGLDAFKAQFLPVVKEGPCGKCHQGQKAAAPAWLLGTPEQIYLSAKNYVNFGSIKDSRIAFRAGNGHCPDCDLPRREIVVDALTRWWEGGEEKCEQARSVRTHAQVIPRDLPSDKFVKMQWSLRDVDVALTGVNFEVEIRRFAEPQGTTPGAYQLRKPRLIGDNPLSVGVRGVRILNNLKYQEFANAFTRIDNIVSPDDTSLEQYRYPVLSPETLVVLQDKEAGDELTVAFDAIGQTKRPACQAFDMFQKNVMPLVKARECRTCHVATTEDLADIRRRARAAMDMMGDEKELCRKFRERTWRDTDVLPALVQYPLFGRFGHTEIFPTRDEVVPAWTDWIRAEWKGVQVGDYGNERIGDVELDPSFLRTEDEP